MMDIIQCMLTKRKMLKTFCPEAVNWTIHVLNRSLALVVKNQTLEEAWSGSKPSIEYFRVFDCVAYVHVPDV